LRQHIALVESSVVSQPNSPVSTSSHTDQVLELLRKLMEYRSDEVRHRLEKVGRVPRCCTWTFCSSPTTSHAFAQGICSRSVLTLADPPSLQPLGRMIPGRRKTIVSIEAGGELKHFRLSSRNIINDLRKNLARFGVAGDVSLINRRFFDEATISEVRQRLSNDDVGPVRFRRRQ